MRRKEAIVLITNKGVKLTYLFLTEKDKKKTNFELLHRTRIKQILFGGIFTYYHPEMDFINTESDGSKIIIDNRNNNK